MQGGDERVEKLYWVSRGNGLYEPQRDASGQEVDPLSLLGIDDMINLRELKDTRALLQTLKTRYERAQIYTNISSIVVAVNPYEDLKLCTEEMKERYSKGESQPHPYKSTNQAFQNMRDSQVKQVFLISGESGAGKTETTKIILKYLAYLSQKNGGGVQQIDIDQRIVEANPILEAFGNAKTLRNNNSSRFGKLIQVHFDTHMQITGGAVKHFLLEISRVVQQNKGERNYHFFYQLCAADIDSKKEKYGLGPAQDYNFIKGCVTVNPRHDAKAAALQDAAEYKETVAAFEKLQFTQALQERIMSTVAAILHLGNLKFTGDGYNAAIADESKEALRFAAKLLDVSADDLEIRLTRSRIVGTAEFKKILVAQAYLETNSFAKLLYEMMFDVILLQCNEAIWTQNTTKTMLILDIFGFECFEFNSFDQLLINFTNERLQKLFNKHIFEEEKSDFEAEGLPFPTAYVDKCSHCIDDVNTKIFTLLGDMCFQATENRDETFANRLKANRVQFAEQGEPGRFIVQHFARDVAYSTTGFIDRARNKLHEDLQKLAEISIQKMKDELRTSAAKIVHQQNILARFQADLGLLMEELDDTQPHYIRCIKPNDKQEPKEFDPLLVKGQLEYSGILNVVQIRQNGYPARIEHRSFYNSYKKLSENQEENDTMQKETPPAPRSTTQRICSDFLERLTSTDPLAGVRKFKSAQAGPLTADLYRVGKSKVWLRSAGYTWLQDRLSFWEQMKAYRDRLGACTEEKDTDRMGVVITQAQDYLPHTDHKLRAAMALHASLMEIVNRMACALEDMKARDTITPEFRRELDMVSASASGAGLSENVKVYRDFQERRKLLMDIEDKLEQEVKEGNYERLKDVYDKAKIACSNAALLNKAAQNLSAMESILNELKQAKATNNLVNVIKAIERNNLLRMSSSELTLGREWLREELLRQLQAFKTPHQLVQQSDLDVARDLVFIKDTYALIRDQAEAEGNIDKAFKLVEAMYDRMTLRRRLQQVTNPINLVSIQQLLTELAEMPQSERFQDDEVEQAQRVYELHGKRLQQAVSALEHAITNKDTKLLFQVLDDHKELLPPDRYKEGKNTLDTIVDVELKLATLLNKNVIHVDELEKWLETNQRMLNSEQPDLVRAQQVLAIADEICSKLSAGMASKNLDDLSAAIEEAKEARLSCDEVQNAKKEYISWKTLNDEFGRALESLEFDRIKDAFVKASGISGNAYTSNVERYKKYVHENNRAKETALLESRAKVAQYRGRRDLEKLRESVAELHRLTGDDVKQWNEMYVGTKLEAKEEFEKSLLEYTEAQALVESLDSIVRKLSECLSNGEVNTIRKEIENLKTNAGLLPPITAVENANLYLSKVGGFQRRLREAFEDKNLDTIESLLDEVKDELKQNRDPKDIFTDDMRPLYASWHTANDRLNQLSRSGWAEKPGPFLQAVRSAQLLDFSSRAFETALDNAQKFVSIQFELALSKLRESNLDSAREYEEDLHRVVEHAKILADDCLFGRKIEEAGRLLNLLLVAYQLQSAWRSRDLDRTSRCLRDTTEQLGGFHVPEVELVVKSAQEWSTEALSLQEELQRYLKSEKKQADLLRVAVETAELVLSGNNRTYRDAKRLHKKLQQDIAKIEGTTDLVALGSLLAATELDPGVSAICDAKAKLKNAENNQTKWEVMSNGGDVEQFKAFVEELKGPLHATATLKLESLRSWITSLNRACEEKNIGKAYELLVRQEFTSWNCEARTRTRSWAVSALFAPLNEKIYRATKELRSETPTDLEGTAYELRDAAQTAQEFCSLDHTNQLSATIAEGLNLAGALDLRRQSAKALADRNEDSLRVLMTNAKKSVVEKAQEWLLPAQVTLRRIDEAKEELKVAREAVAFLDLAHLKPAIAAAHIERLRIAIDTAKRGTGSTWPDAPPLKEDDPSLRAAITSLAELTSRSARREEGKLHAVKLRNFFANKLGDLYKTLASRFQLANDQQSLAKDIPNRSFKLGDIIAKWHAVVPYLLRASSKHEPSTRGAHAALAALQELWYMDNVAWKTVRDDVRIGLVKETKDCGNTSVSMGLAKIYFDRNPDRGFVGFMNCGSGGVKYQLYARGDDGIVITLGEFKPARIEGRAPALFKLLDCGAYKPGKDEKQDAVTAEDLHKSMAAENALAPWKDKKLIAEYFEEEPEVFAFVTGDLRNDFAKQGTEEREKMNDIVSTVFGNGHDRLAKPVSQLLYKNAGIPFLPRASESYIITQADEGRMELEATQTLYRQIHAVLPNTEELQVIVSFGIGRSSTQFAQARADGIEDELPPMEYQKGMDKSQVMFVGEDIVQDYLSKPVLLNNLIVSIRQCRSQNTWPTIALKSGCLLALELNHPAHAMFTKALALRVSPKTSQTLTIKAGRPETDEIKQLVVKLPSSVSELCSEAAILFRCGLGSEKEKHIQFIRAIDVASTHDLTEVTGALHNRTIHFIGTDFKVPPPPEKKIVWFEDLVDYISPDWRNKSPKATEQKVLGIPFGWIPDKWHLVKDRLGKGKHEKDNQKIRGTQGALTALKDVYYMNDGAWRDRVLIGIIKSTFECGNSSVSMGLAVSYFANKAINKDENQVVGFLNCGTGGNKFQLYTNLPQQGQGYRVALIAELKPGETSFADLKVDVPGIEYKCKYPTSIEEVRRRVFKQLSDAPWSQPSWPMHVPLFGFITGPLRDHFEGLKGSDLQDALREFVNRAFVAPRKVGEEKSDRPEIQVSPVSDILSTEAPPSYFISNENEGQMELFGLRRMYAQMDPGVDPLVGFGIGRKSSHVTVVSAAQHDPTHSDSRMFGTVGHALPGMSDKQVLNIGPRLVQGFKEPVSQGMGTQLDNLVAVVKQSLEENRRPMIALKSGCLLMIDEEATLRAQFTEAPLSAELDDQTRSVAQRVGSVVQRVPSYTLKIAPIEDKRYQRVLQWVLNTEKVPGFTWGRAFQLPKSDGPNPDGPEATLPLLNLQVRVPVTSSRLCAMAAVAYGVPTTSYFRVFFDALENSNHGNVLKLFEWKGTIGKEEMGIVKNFLGVPKKFQGCLYFSPEHDLSDGEPEAPRTAVAMPDIFQAGQNPDEAVELYHRAQAIYTSNEEFTEQDLKQRYNWSNEQYQQLATWMASAPDVGLRVMKPYHLSAVVAPPYGPSVQAGQAVESLELKLPIGQYTGTAGALFYAIAQQLQALRVRPRGAESNHSSESVHMDVKYSWQKEGKEEKEADEKACLDAVARVYSEITLNVINAGAWEPERFGNGLKHAWILKRGNDWSPLWTPRAASAEDLELRERLRPYLQDSSKDLSAAFRVFGHLWGRIVAFRDEPPIQDQVMEKMRELVSSFSESSLRASQVATENAPQFRSVEQWKVLIAELEKTMEFSELQGFKEAVALAFRVSLVDLWRASDRSQWPPQTRKEWASAVKEFYWLLSRNLTAEHFREFGLESEKEEILRELDVEAESEPVHIHT